MTAPSEVVFLLDVDNTLLDNDHIVDDLRAHLDREFGNVAAARYWAHFEELRSELDYADYLGALQRWRLDAEPMPGQAMRLLGMSGFLVPDPTVAAQRVAFGTSGHHGSAFDGSFNEWHVLAITQSICRYRKASHIDGPLFLGIDTHALWKPACASALEVLAANGVDVMLAAGGEYTPTLQSQE